MVATAPSEVKQERPEWDVLLVPASRPPTPRNRKFLAEQFTLEELLKAQDLPQPRHE